jgi:hypothetical protein
MQVSISKTFYAYGFAGLIVLFALSMIIGAVAVNASPAYWIAALYNNGSVNFNTCSVDSVGSVTFLNSAGTLYITQIARGYDGYLYCAGYNSVAGNSNLLWRINEITGIMDSSWSISNLSSNSANANMCLKCGPDGNLYFTQSGRTYIDQINPASMAVTQISLGGGSPNTMSGGIAFDQTGRYAYVSQVLSGNYEVNEYDMKNFWAPVPGFVIYEPVHGGIQQIYGLVGGTDGNLYVSNYYNSTDGHSTVYRFNQSTGVWDSTWSATTGAAGTSTRVKDLAWDGSNGNTMLYATANNATLVRVNASLSGAGQTLANCLTLSSPYTYIYDLTMNTPFTALTANVTLNGYVGDMSLVNLRVDIRDSTDSVTIKTQTVTPSAPVGSTSVTTVMFPTVPTGSYIVRASAGKWLTSSTPVTFSSGNTVVGLSLLNGDLNGDNYVEDQDYSIMGEAWYQGGT